MAKDRFAFSLGSSRGLVMGFFRWLLWGRGYGLNELARRLGTDPRVLRRLQPRYREFTIPKRSGGTRRILAPDDELKKLQRRVLRRLLARLRAHPAAHGFERGRSIVTNARAHQRQEVVVRFDLAARPRKIAFMRAFVGRIVGEEGYRVHRRKKMSVRRRHHCQMVTGLVVNDRVNLPRKTRRWLRAVEHRTRKAKQSPFDFAHPAANRPTLTPGQLDGWRALQAMIASQAADAEQNSPSG